VILVSLPCPQYVLVAFVRVTCNTVPLPVATRHLSTPRQSSFWACISCQHIYLIQTDISMLHSHFACDPKLVSSHEVSQHKLYTYLLFPYATCPVHHTFNLLAVILYFKSTDWEAPDCVVFSIPLLSNLFYQFCCFIFFLHVISNYIDNIIELFLS
jgi:hypothetical protein